jgi:hypothetical protein
LTAIGFSGFEGSDVHSVFMATGSWLALSVREAAVLVRAAGILYPIKRKLRWW